MCEWECEKIAEALRLLFFIPFHITNCVFISTHCII